MSSLKETLEQVFRDEYGRMIATLIRISGSFDLAEESLQEAFTKALTHWEQQGVPRNPGAWLTTVAHRKVIDTRRREKTRSLTQQELQYESEYLQSQESESNSPEASAAYPDDRLRLIFTCCHPALGRESQIALTLRTLGGLTTTEIARAFLIAEPTLAQRLVRAKTKIRKAGIPYQIPSPELLPQRLEAARTVIYLIFNEGYSATMGDQLVRRDLCSESIRLGRLLCELMPKDPENLGLLALLLLQDSRRQARTDTQGDLVTLEEQNRSQWDYQEIAEGLNLLGQAISLGQVGVYQLQASIASIHARAQTAAETDWPQIVSFYQELLRLYATPVVALNHAVAVAMSEGYEKGLDLIEAAGASEQLEAYPLFHAARADLFRRLGRNEKAVAAYTRALELTTNRVERRYLRRRLDEVAAKP